MIGPAMSYDEIDAVMSRLTPDLAGLYEPQAIADMAMELLGKNITVVRQGEPPNVVYRAELSAPPGGSLTLP